MKPTDSLADLQIGLQFVQRFVETKFCARKWLSLRITRKENMSYYWTCVAHMYGFFRKVMNVYVRSILTFSRILIPIDSIHMCLKAFDQIRPLTASK